MHPDQGLGEPLVVSGQPLEARYPGKGTLHHPAAGQQDEAPLGLGELYHFQADAHHLGGILGLLAGVALLHKGPFDRVARGFLDRIREGGFVKALFGYHPPEKIAAEVNALRPKSAAR